MKKEISNNKLCKIDSDRIGLLQNSKVHIINIVNGKVEYIVSINETKFFYSIMVMRGMLLCGSDKGIICCFNLKTKKYIF